MILRNGRLEERQALEDLQRRASLAYEEDRATLLANPDVIELPSSQLRNGHVRVVEKAGVVLGFASVLPRGDGDLELDGLFVEPSHWGLGIGRALIEDVIGRLPHGAELQVLANPRAEAFYARLGFVAFATVQTLFGPANRMRTAYREPRTR